MIEQHPRWQVGQEVAPPKVNPYKIIQLVGEAGNIHIDQKGFYHVYWHRERPDGQIVLVHHGGEEGFSDLLAVKHQHERVILKYTGMRIDIPSDQQTEIPPEERAEGLPTVDGDFPTLAGQLRELRLPGEQRVIRQWIGVLQEVSQDLPTVKSHGQLTEIREKLAELLEKKDLIRSTNKYKQVAVSSLQKGVSGGRGDLLSGASEAQLQFLKRAQQTVNITLGTMKRYNDVEKLQITWNGSVESVFSTLVHLFSVLNPDYRVDWRDRALTHALEGASSVFTILNSLKGEPYFSKAQKMIEVLSPVSRRWEARQRQPLLYEKMPGALEKPLEEIAIWRQRIQEEYTGVDFGKYALS